MRRQIAFIAAAALAISAAALPVPAGAHDADALESVRVTAQKRGENVQQVPMSVDVVTSAEVEAKGIRDFQDLDLAVPNLVVNSAGAGTYSFFGLRGRVNNSSEIDPTVTVMIDGVPYVDFTTITSMPLFDVERIEVLRGPQSTLYGMNSEAGVIKVVTRRPGPVPRAMFGLTLGDGRRVDSSYSFQGSLSGPVAEDLLALGFAFSAGQKGGWLHNVANPTRDGRVRQTGGRFSAALTPASGFSADLNVTFSQVRTRGGYVGVPMTEEAAAKMYLEGFPKYTVNNDYPEFAEIDDLSADLTLRLETGAADLISVTAWRRAVQRFHTDMDTGQLPGIDMYGTMDVSTTTFMQELRAVSPEDSPSPFSWLGGVFFVRTRSKPILSAISRNAFMPSYGIMMDNTLDREDFAVFGQATFRTLGGRLGLTAGLRGEWTRRTMDDKIYLAGREVEATDSELLPKFSVDYRITDDNMVYASAAMGWRPGGIFNQTMNLMVTEDDVRFGKETSWTYEVGSKNVFLDGALRVNLALFRTVYRGYLDEYYVASWIRALKNAGRAVATGFEIDAAADVGDRLTVTASLGFVDAKYKVYRDDLGNDYSGNKIAGVPAYNAAVGLRVRHRGFYVAPEVRLKGKTWWERRNLYHEDPYATLHLRAGYETENWEVFVYGDNLTSEYAFTRGIPSFVSDTVYDYGVPIRPLEIGVGVNVFF